MNMSWRNRWVSKTILAGTDRPFFSRRSTSTATLQNVEFCHRLPHSHVSVFQIYSCSMRQKWKKNLNQLTINSL